MTALRCTAETCMYNEDKLCSRGDIEVQGSHATTMDETCCGSFRERSCTSNCSGCGCGCDTINIVCKAESCVYNDNTECHAGSIDITGSNAECCGETCCGTFRSRM